MIDVWGIGYDLIERMGLTAAARDRGYMIDRLTLVDDDGRRVAGFDANVFRRALGGRFFSIPRGDLARILFDAIEGDVEMLYSTSIENLREEGSGVDVELTGGLKRRFDLVVGADGFRSRVRECAFGPKERYEAYLGYWVASFVTVGYPHRDEGAYVGFALPRRQIFRYALREDRSAFLFTVAHDGALDVAAHDLGARKRLVRDSFGDAGWECGEILECLDASDDVYFDAVSQIRVPSWSSGRVVLVGDAAYCPSLVAGAGAAFAMLGAYVLAGELKRAADHHTAAFNAYEARIRPFIDTEQRKATRLASSFAPRTAFGIFVRNTALQLMRVEPLAAWCSRAMFASPFDLPNY